MQPMRCGQPRGAGFGKRFRLCMTLLCFTGAAFAQSASDSGEATLAEVVVTAQKREQSVQDVPISISAYGGDFLDRAGISTIEDISRLAPDFAIASGSQQINSIVSIRGIGSVGNNAIEPSVGIFIDGVYYPRAGSVIGQIPDVESVEVLRGPQGTLFGRNTPVGALNITTRNPDHEAGAHFQAGIGSYNTFELGAVVNGGLGDDSAGRLVIRYADQGDPWLNLLDGQHFGGRENLILRGKFSLEVSDRLSLMSTLDYARLDTTGMATEVLNDTVPLTFDSRLTSLYGSTATTANARDGRVNQVHEDFMKDEQGGVALDARYRFGSGMQMRSISAWRDWRANVLESAIRIPGDILPRFSRFDTRTLSQELQLLSTDGAFIEWVAGLYLYREEYDIEQGFNAGDDYCVPTVEFLLDADQAQDCLGYPQDRFVVSNFNQDLDSIAAFGQATWHVSERVASTLGVRWTRDSKHADFAQVATNPYATLVRADEQAQGMRVTDSQATWFANLSWFPAPDIMLFATASTGYKSGGFNPEGSNEVLGAERRAFDAEDSGNFELGLKSRLLRGRMTANVTAFRTDLKDFQDRAFDGISFNVLNAGRIRQQGIEADVKWRPARPLELMVGASYLDSEYLSFPAAPPLPGDTEPQNLAGTRKTNSPKWQLATDADLYLGFSTHLEWFGGVGLQYTSAQDLGLISNHNPQSIQPAYAIFNVRVGLRPYSDRWDVTLFGRNLADKGYCLSMGDQPLGGPLGAVDAANHGVVQRCILGAPRSWNLRVSWRY